MEIKKNLSINIRALLAVLFIIVIFAVSVGYILYQNSTKKSAGRAYIYQNDKLIKTVDLSDVSEPYRITIETEDGGSNVLEVRQGSIGVVEASCPDHLCKNMGFISNSLMPITCLPNHLVIKVTDGACEDATELDGVAY